jgi:hypothetical protein
MSEVQKDQWDDKTRGPKMSETTGDVIWKYQMPVSEEFEMTLPKGAQILRTHGENGGLWLWAIVNTNAPDEKRKFKAFKCGGSGLDTLKNLEYVGCAAIYIQAELMLYIFEEKQ